MTHITNRRWLAVVRDRTRLALSSWVFHLFLSGVIIVVVFLRPPSIFSGDTDTARNYLNTIVSSLSTILALCISIILVAIQMTASNYTHRVLDFFVRLPYNASLFVIYLVTIMHSFFLMAKIRDPVNDPLPVSLRPEMSADLVLVVICFLSLILYMYAVVQLLKPERIIRLILRDYTRAVTRRRWRAALDNVEQICDIAKRAASVNDSVTGARCTEAMSFTVSSLPMPAGADDPLLSVHGSVVDQWVEIVGVAVKERETGLLYGALDALHQQGRAYIEAQSWAAAEQVVRAYRHIVFSHLLCEGQTYYVERVAGRLYQLAMYAAQENTRGRMFCLRTWQVIETIGENAFNAQPATAGTLMDGLLMASEVYDTLSLLRHREEMWRALGTYFALWKSFVRVCFVRDAARWAAWWQEHVAVNPIAPPASSLAVLMAMHAGREDVAKTLCYRWERDVRGDEIATLYAEFREGVKELFDGWPLPSIERLKMPEAQRQR
ncbi:DUF2254 domain-containing protein [Alicyclobacillus cycloheptanicus]|uniref:Membrane protein n=1 Tax=Alicyclobacillus cycloheptanicus TaxID=1457 RepID=A0ABT9XKJ5_9BACL|nr:DUF2254 family protein [Alicyclobacillus cycloheptanicus]MDQ0190822.1 putative membrane protein [Alicyclobacillus cycloheptanicus]WDM01477.1 DUF2254 domain-containing protein [Alicyclobacillus cycloheptanicus]